ncbi:hypothetical protein BCR36DRAFT_581520 [Piromyces finnis]|uniref:Spc7 kinetochore protein domain-containing protein n=1 Tax=Piromyces finnis TaxID=1754191 RepID=A0A1Y1VGG9_9FUNG|nr:hypothetical protein BCR36DRAFT_581520 [Piromyces finnis]|eukprot:ORX55526.1 hypothetical protein BCR36DRAFT_581520 [Piromyces finnis]
MTSFNKDIRKRRSKSLGDTLLTQKRIKSSLAQMPKGCLKSPSRSMIAEDNEDLEFGITMSEKKRRRRSIGRRVSFASKTRVRVFEKNSKFSTPQIRKLSFHENESPDFPFVDNNDSPLKLQNINSLSKFDYKDNYIDKHGVIHFDSDSDRQNSNLSSYSSESHLLDNENREEVITEIMDRIASKNEKTDSINNSFSSKSFNDKFKEKDDFSNIITPKITDKDKGDFEKFDSNFDINADTDINNTINNIINTNNKKENKNEDKDKNHYNNDEIINNINEIDNENENTNESDSKGDISGIIVGSNNENYNINNQKSVGGIELEEKMDNEILSNQGFDDLPNNNNNNNLNNNNNDDYSSNNNINNNYNNDNDNNVDSNNADSNNIDSNNIDNNNIDGNNNINDEFYNNSEEEFTATMELTQPFTNSINEDESIQKNYSNNISIANQFINKANSNTINIDNLSSKKDIEFKIFKENRYDNTQSNSININNIPMNDETLHTEVMDIDISLSMKKPINITSSKDKPKSNEKNFELNELTEKEDDLTNKKLFSKNQDLKDILRNNDEKVINNRENKLLFETIKENDKQQELSKKQTSQLITKNKSNASNDNSDENKSDNENNTKYLMEFFANKNPENSRKDSRLFFFSSQQSNLSTLTTDDQLNDTYDDYNKLIKDIADRIPDSPEGSLNGTQSDYVLSQQSENESNSSKETKNKISKIDLLLQNKEISHNIMTNETDNINNINSKDIDKQLEKENYKKLEKLNNYENIYKEYENEDESYNFMSSYGKDRKKKIENSANFILKDNISDIENLNKNDDSITDNLLKNRYKQQSEFLNSKLAALRRISSMGPYNDEGDNISKIKNNINEDDNEEQTMDITVGVGSILSTNKVTINKESNNQYKNSNSTINKISNKKNIDEFSDNDIENSNNNNEKDKDQFARPKPKNLQSENDNSLVKSQDLMLIRNESQNSVINEYINILTPIKNSLLNKMNRNNQINNDQKENNINTINEFRTNSTRISNILPKNLSKKENDDLFQNHTLDERDIERNNSIRLSSTIDVLPTVSPHKRYSILPTRATPSNKRQSRSYSIFNEIIQTPRSLRERKRQQDLLNDSINSYNSISLNKPLNISSVANITNTQEVESPTILLGNEELGNEDLLNEELSIMGGDISLSEDILPEEKTVTLSRYLQLIGIQFKDDFNKKPERKFGNLEINNDQFSEIEKLKSLSVYVQELEGLQYECNDIQKSIEECKNALDNYEKEYSNNLPVAFQEYNKAIDDKRKNLQKKFKTTQEYSRLKAKQAWYRWRTSMSNGIIKKYKKSIDLFKMDMEKINEFSSEITKYVPSMKIYYNQLMETINLNKSQEVFSESFEERMALLEKKIHEQKQIILKLKTEIMSYEKEKEVSIKKVDELKNTIDQLKNVIEQYEERIKQLESSIYTKETLQKCKKEHNLVVNVSNWNINNLSPDLISYIYDDIILVSFNRRNQSNLIYDVDIDFINMKKSKYRIDIEKFKPVIKGIQNKISVCKNDKNIRKTLDEVAYYWNKLTKLFQDIELVQKTNIVEIYIADSKDIESKEMLLSMQSNTTIVRIVFFDGKQKYRYFIDIYINSNCAYPYGKLNWRFIYKYGSVKYELVKQIINDTPKGKRRLEEICRNLRTIQV